jgi:hypothetical protein
MDLLSSLRACARVALIWWGGERETKGGADVVGNLALFFYSGSTHLVGGMTYLLTSMTDDGNAVFTLQAPVFKLSW